MVRGEMMNFKINNISFSQIAEDAYSRMDCDYFTIRKEYNVKSMDKLRNYITFLESGKPIKAADYEDDTENIHVTVRNIDDGELNLEDAIFICDEKADKLADFRLQKDDVCIAISSNCGQAFVYDGKSDYNLTMSHYMCRVRVKKDLLDEKYLVLYMKSKLVRDYYRSVETGKTIKNLAQYYVKEMPVIIPSLPEQRALVADVKPVEDELRALKAKITPIKDIINSVFGEYFHYDYDTFEEKKTHKIYNAGFSMFGNNIDSRFSVKFHRPAGEFVYQELQKYHYKKLKQIVSVPMITGQGISDEYDENGTCYYVSMGDISKWELSYDDLKTVSDEYATTKNTKKIKGVSEPQSTKLEVNDIVMMRSGEGGIGKVAIIEDDIDAIFCDFLIRIRVDEKVANPLFAYYYCRTDYFQYLVEINKKGLGNNTNIFPNNLQDFPFPDLSLTEQEKIVSQVKAKMHEQDSIKAEIKNKKRIIEDKIEAAMKKFQNR